MTISQCIGEKLEAHWLPYKVLSCADAALAKGIPLENELKTLVLSVDFGKVVAVHVRGNRHLSLRSVKQYLNVEQALLMDIVSLASLGCVPGTVCPFLPPVWGIQQLISKEVLTLNYMSTNNGTHTGYFLFAPKLLQEVPSWAVGEFEVPLGLGSDL